MISFLGYVLYVTFVVVVANLISWSLDMPIDRVFIFMLLGYCLSNEWKKIK